MFGPTVRISRRDNSTPTLARVVEVQDSLGPKNPPTFVRRMKTESIVCQEKPGTSRSGQEFPKFCEN